MIDRKSSCIIEFIKYKIKQEAVMLQYFITFSQGVDKFNITGAQMFDSIYDMTEFF